MAALSGDTRQRSSTEGSHEEDLEDRIILLSGEDMSNVNTDSEMSDDNREESGLKLIKQTSYSSIEYSKKQMIARKTKHIYSIYCTPRYVVNIKGVIVYVACIHVHVRIRYIHVL